LSHITGGGLLENLPRVIPASCNAVIDSNSWQWPPVFRWLQQQGNVDTREMYRTFNCGVGMVVCVAADAGERALACLRAQGLDAWTLGQVTSGDNRVELA
jgi:phosphoribosylformylglycinamidine cyclo-ligase